MAQTLPLKEVKADEVEIVQSTTQLQNTGKNEMQRADVIIAMTRTYNGVKQYRRWNETQKKWVDPYWINMI